MTSEKEKAEEDTVKDQCVACLGPGGDPRNGGLCSRCAPPIRADVGPETRMRTAIRRLFGGL
jgi:hypothetical protein